MTASVKICTGCKAGKPIEDFCLISRTGKRQAWCRQCKNEYATRYRNRIKNDPVLHKKRVAIEQAWYKKQRNDPEKWAQILETQREKRKQMWRTDPHYRAVTTEKNRRARLRRMQNEVARNLYNERTREKTKELKEKVFQFYGNACVCCGETGPIFLTIDHIDNNGYLHRKAGISGVALFRLLIKENFPQSYQILCFNCNWGRFANDGICPHQSLKGSETIPIGSTPKQVEAPSSTVNTVDDDIVRSVQ